MASYLQLFMEQCLRLKMFLGRNRLDLHVVYYLQHSNVLGKLVLHKQKGWDRGRWVGTPRERKQHGDVCSHRAHYWLDMASHCGMPNIWRVEEEREKVNSEYGSATDRQLSDHTPHTKEQLECMTGFLPRWMVIQETSQTTHIAHKTVFHAAKLSMPSYSANPQVVHL